MDHGDEVASGLLGFARDHALTAASFTAIGAFSEAVVAYFNPEQSEYEEIPIDEDGRDRLLETFQTHYHPGSTGSVSETALEQGDEEIDEGETGQEPGRED